MYIFGRTVANYIVNMPTGIKAGVGLKIFKKNFEIALICLCLSAIFKESIIIRVQTICNMSRAYKKIKISGSTQSRNFFF